MELLRRGLWKRIGGVGKSVVMFGDGFSGVNCFRYSSFCLRHNFKGPLSGNQEIELA